MSSSRFWPPVCLFAGYATGGVVDQVQPGENGILVPVSDLEEATKTLVDLLRSPTLIDELAGRARKSLERNFDNQKIIGDLIAIYESVRANAQAKVPQLSPSHELAEYEEFALPALADLLESAEKRSSELQGEVDWLREYIEHQSFELGQLRPEVDRLRTEVDRLQIYVARLEQERVVIHAELDFLRDYRRKVDRVLNPFRKLPGFKWAVN
jgi:chromosome segregation ATPase